MTSPAKPRAKCPHWNPTDIPLDLPDASAAPRVTRSKGKEKVRAASAPPSPQSQMA
jgi:hypothetical protein